MQDVRAAKQEKARRLISGRFSSFVPYIRPRYDMRWFHRVIADRLQLVYERKVKKLMLFVPPQHGKSELSTRSFPAWVLGKDPGHKIAVVSYADAIASKFNRDIRRRIESARYADIFGSTRMSTGRDGYTKNNDILEVVGQDGFLYTVGVGGSLTSVTVDMGIIDDPIKDRQDAQSPTIRGNVWDWYTDVFQTRLHNESVQILIQTRWHEEDLAGLLLAQDGVYSEENPIGWHVISFPAIRTDAQNDFDPRQPGEALWPERHSLEKILAIKQNNKVTYNALYQQDPKPAEDSLVYPLWTTCQTFPECDVVFYGLDFGYTNDPTALVKIGRQNNRLYVQELIYETGLTNADIAARMLALGVPTTAQIYADSAEPKSIDELKAGFTLSDGTRLPRYNVIGATKGADSVSAGISKLKEFTVHMTESSINVRREAGKYQWVMMGSKPTNEPVDANNHSMDAIRYAVYTKYVKPPKDFFAL